MEINSYTPCPGGKKKKLRFCCRDLMKDIDKIWRMADGEQYQAALRHVDQLLVRPQFADRACLMAIRAELLEELGKVEEFCHHAQRFVEKHPDSPVAWAECALAHISRADVPLAVDAVQDALERMGDQCESRVLISMHQLAQLLLFSGHFHAARCMWLACADVARRAGLPEAFEKFLQHVHRVDRASNAPPLVKAGFQWRAAPEDAPWKARFDELLPAMNRHCWRRAARGLAELIEQVPDSPVLWHDLALLRIRLADTAGAIEALKRQAQCEESLEDAVEAETLAMLLQDDPLGDAWEEYAITWTVRDPEPLHEALLSDRQVRMLPVSDDMRPEDGSPLPKLAAILLDRPPLDSPEEITPENLPRVLAVLHLFGRQTDRPARLELLEIYSSELDQVVEYLRRLGGEHLEADFERKTTGKISAVAAMLQSRWFAPRGTNEEHFSRIGEEYRRHVICEHWPQMPLGLFDGRTPEAVADDPSCRRKLLAAILLLDQWVNGDDFLFDFNQLRQRLGLPTLEPIRPAPGEVKTLPPVRLRRVEPEGLSDDSARMGLARDAESYEEASQHLDVLSEMLPTGDTLKGQLEVLRLQLAARHGEAEEVRRLMDVIPREYQHDPDVIRELFRALIALGILRPDGTPARPPRAPQPAPQQAEQASANELWTPDTEPSDSSAGGSSGGLWTPD